MNAKHIYAKCFNVDSMSNDGFSIEKMKKITKSEYMYIFNKITLSLFTDSIRFLG